MRTIIKFEITFVLLNFLGLIFFQGCVNPSFDIIIVNGTVYDGLGNPGKKINIGIREGEIVALGDIKNMESSHTIDAAGMAVSPGFIDLHAHLEDIHKNPNALSKLYQGVTTTLGGPDGFSPFPLQPFLDSLETLPLGVNVAYLIGHNTIRDLVMGLDNRDPTSEELRNMLAMLDQGMEEGAFGISTGLKYLPGAFSRLDELVMLSKVAAKHGGFYTSHLREEGLGLLEGVKEAIEIGHRAGIPIILTHHKVVGKPSWGNSRVTLAMVDSANKAGLDVQIDQYPYTASFTELSILIPSWSLAGGNDEFTKRVEDPSFKEKIKREIISNILNDRGGGDIKNIQFSKVAWNKELENKTLADWAIMRELEPTPDTGAELIIEAQTKGGANAIFHAMTEDDVMRILRHPRTMVASDGRLVKFGEGHPHPRVYGTFPRVLGKYVREEKLLTLEEAIKKMTYLPAKRLGLVDRGSIEVGKKADIVVFDPETIIDKATFSQPHQYPEGIQYVLVNGTMSIVKNETSHIFAGEVLRKRSE